MRGKPFEISESQPDIHEQLTSPKSGDDGGYGREISCSSFYLSNIAIKKYYPIVF